MPIAKRLIKSLPEEEAGHEIASTLDKILSAASKFFHLWTTPEVIPREGLDFMRMVIGGQDNDYVKELDENSAF